MRDRFAPKLLSFMVILIALVAAGLLAAPNGALANHTPTGTYTNPAYIQITSTGGLVQSFADPSIIRGTDGNYYAYGTSDPLNDADRDPNGNLLNHKIPMVRSQDLVHWTYIGDAFSSVPGWTAPSAGLFAPDIRYLNNQYYLYYAATDVQDAVSGEPNCAFDSAIGVATSPNPYGPWTDLGRPVVYPRRGGPGCNFFATIDSTVIQDDIGQLYIYFGSYYGGILARRLSSDGTSAPPSTETQIAIPNRYEASYVVRRNGFYYLFASATDCCRGPLTGYSVFAGRSSSPLGPFVDRLGVPLTDARVGGNVVISMNGNRWMGPGHNSVITDQAGQDWFVYHAIDRNDPYFSNPNPYNITKRPLMMDRLDWINGWPTVRAGYWASDTPQTAPVTTAGGTPQPTPNMKPIDVPGPRLDGPSDDFNGSLEPQWGWVRQPPPSQYSLTENPGFFRFRTQAADLYQDNNSASVLTETAPTGEFMVETKFEFNAPPSGCCFNFQQGGILLYQDDDHYVKLSQTSIFETRQTEWAKEVGAGEPDAARTNTYGNSVIGPPGQPSVMTTTTWLRIVKRINPDTGQQLYTGYSSFDGVNWERGATWTHDLSNIKIGLVAMGGSGLTVDFDYLYVYTIQSTPASTTTLTAVPSSTSTSISTTVPSSTTTSTAVPSSTTTSTAVPSSTSTSTPTRTAVPSATASATATATVCRIQFQDVPPSSDVSSFYPFVQCLACRGVLGGYPCGGTNNQTGQPEPCGSTGNPYFRPSNNITRAQIAKVVSNAAGFNNAVTGQTYADVTPSSDVSSFYVYIERLSQRNVMGGYPCDPTPGATFEPCDGQNRAYFRPGNSATRGQLAKIVSNAAGFVENVSGQTFADVPPSTAASSFYVYVERLARRGVIGGYPCGTTDPNSGPCDAQNRAYFRPGNTVTRAQAAKIVANTFFPNCQPR